GAASSQRINWAAATTTPSGLLPSFSATLTDSLDLKADGNVALNALNGVVVATGHFDLTLGQVSTQSPSNGVNFSNANAVSLSLDNVQVWIGASGTLDTHGTANDFSDDTIVNGTL